jgi:hypothetical protein
MEGLSMVEELPEELRDPMKVMERGRMLNTLLDQRNEMARLLRYLLDYSNARALLSDSYIADVEAAIGSPRETNDTYHYEAFQHSFMEHSDPSRASTSYDWLNGMGRLWRDAIDTERSQSSGGADHG